MAVFESYLTQIVSNSDKMKRLKEFITKLPEDIKGNERLKQFYNEIENDDRDKFTISFMILPEYCKKVLLKFIHRLYETNNNELWDSEEIFILNKLTPLNDKDKGTL